MFSKNFESLAAEFIEQGRYLRSWSPKTVRSYQQGLNAFQGAIGDVEKLTKSHLSAFVLHLRDRGMSPGGCNAYIRAVNSFLTWLHSEERVPEDMKKRAVRRMGVDPASVRTIIKGLVSGKLIGKSIRLPIDDAVEGRLGIITAKITSWTPTRRAPIPDHDCHASPEDGCEGCGRREV